MEELFYTHEEKYLCALEEVRYGDPAKAKIMLEHLLADEPGYGRAHYLLGYLYTYFFKDFGKAAELFRICIEFDPFFTDVYPEYLKVLRWLDHKKEFEQLYQKALTVNVTCKTCLHTQAAYYAESEGDLQKAITLFRKAAKTSLGNCDEDVETHINRIAGKIYQNRTYHYNIA